MSVVYTRDVPERPLNLTIVGFVLRRCALLADPPRPLYKRVGRLIRGISEMNNLLRDCSFHQATGLGNGAGPISRFAYAYKYR
jgi:hypothetical protein